MRSTLLKPVLDLVPALLLLHFLHFSLKNSFVFLADFLLQSLLSSFPGFLLVNPANVFFLGFLDVFLRRFFLGKVKCSFLDFFLDHFVLIVFHYQHVVKPSIRIVQLCHRF